MFTKLNLVKDSTPRSRGTVAGFRTPTCLNGGRSLLHTRPPQVLRALVLCVCAHVKKPEALTLVVNSQIRGFTS